MAGLIVLVEVAMDTAQNRLSIGQKIITCHQEIFFRKLQSKFVFETH